MIGSGDLIRFLTTDVSYFEHSTFGATLDAVTDRAFSSRPCPMCKTFGILDEPWVQTHHVFYDTNGREVSREKLEKPIRHPTGKDCEKCKGQGYLPVRVKKNESNVTARPTINRQSSQKECPPDAVLIRYASVSRRLSRMSAKLAGALVDCWGDPGESLKDSFGRAWACAPRTDAGLELLRHLRETNKGKRNVEPWRHLEALLEESKLDKVSPLEKRTALLSKIAVESVELLSIAERQWEALFNAGQ